MQSERVQKRQERERETTRVCDHASNTKSLSTHKYLSRCQSYAWQVFRDFQKSDSAPRRGELFKRSRPISINVVRAIPDRRSAIEHRRYPLLCAEEKPGPKQTNLLRFVLYAAIVYRTGSFLVCQPCYED